MAAGARTAVRTAVGISLGGSGCIRMHLYAESLFSSLAHGLQVTLTVSAELSGERVCSDAPLFACA